MTLSTQFMTMLTMISMGILFGASLDTYNRFLQRKKRKGWLIFINDLLFWLFQALSVFYVLFLVNLGEWRFYIFLALLCGFAAYQSLLKTSFLKILEIAIKIVISTYRIIVKTVRLLVFRPIQLFIMMVLSCIIFIQKGLFTLAKLILSVLLFILRIIFKILLWVFSLILKFMPKSVKKRVDKMLKKWEGFRLRLQNYISKWIKKRKK
ncbi:spore cortex biosynthesis protein YabQ [Bacillaceae bacterium Marseille-Q3522]|nr:spore cortex biosynthesis protein YabQ [Bacillaceae bacterium Marseille-Q3522]